MTHPDPPMPDGYYWAHTTDPDSGDPCPWEPVDVWTFGGKQVVLITGDDKAYDLSDFTFGQRIEEPAKKHGDTIIGNFAEWRCPSCRAESWDTACVIANETWLNCKCGVRVKVVYPINTPPPASSEAHRQEPESRS